VVTLVILVLVVADLIRKVGVTTGHHLFITDLLHPFVHHIHLLPSTSTLIINIIIDIHPIHPRNESFLLNIHLIRLKHASEKVLLLLALCQ